MNSVNGNNKLSRAQIGEILLKAKASHASKVTAPDICPPNLLKKALNRNDSEHCRALKAMSAQKHIHLLKCYSSLYSLASTCLSLEDFDKKAKTLDSPPLEREAGPFRQAALIVRNSIAKKLTSTETAEPQKEDNPFQALPSEVRGIIFSMAGIDAIRARRVCKLFDRFVKQSLTNISLCQSPKIVLSDHALISLALSAPNLNEVILNGDYYGVTNVGIFALLTLCKGLKKLSVQKGHPKCPGIISTTPFHFLEDSKLPLQHLSLSRCFSRSDIDDGVNGEKEVSDDDLRNVGRVCPDLQNLQMTSRSTLPNGWSQDNAITEEGLKLFASQCPKLKSLHSGALVHLKKDFLLTLPDLFPNLISIDLSRSNADDEVVRVFAAKLPKLQEISLRGCKITDVGLHALLSCNTLAKVDARDCDAITAQGKEFLVASRPSLEVSITPQKPNHGFQSGNT